MAFVWEVWHSVASTLLLRGRRATDGTGLARLIAVGRLGAACSCVASLALGDVDMAFARQTWHLATSTLLLRGRHGTCGTGLQSFLHAAEVFLLLSSWNTHEHVCVLGGTFILFDVFCHFKPM